MRELPYPDITAMDTKGQLDQITEFLNQLVEELGYILTSVEEDNLSLSLRKKIELLNTKIENAGEQAGRDRQRVKGVTRELITVSDVLNSAAYEADRNAQYERILQHVAEQREEIEQNLTEKQGIITDTITGKQYRLTISEGNLEIMEVTEEQEELENA